MIIKEQQAEKLEKFKISEQDDNKVNAKDQIKDNIDHGIKNKKSFLYDLLDGFKSFGIGKKLLIERNDIINPDSFDPWKSIFHEVKKS